MVFPSFVVKKLESIFIFVTMNLVFFWSVTRSSGEDILSILVRNNKKCLPKLLFISLLIYRRLRSLPVARGVQRNSALVGEERRRTAQDSKARLPTAVREMHPRFSPVQAVNKANTKIAKQRTLRKLASIIGNLHNLSSSDGKTKTETAVTNMMKQRMLQKTKILKTQ